LSPRLFLRLLSKCRADGSRDHAALLDRDVGQRIAHEVNGATLPGRAKHLARGLLQTSWLSLITSLTPRSPRPVRERRNLVQNGSASDGPTSMPRTSRRPSAFAPTAIITATDMILPPSRTLTYVASIHT